jgi:hypothetical protein
MDNEPTRDAGDPSDPEGFPVGLFLLVALGVVVGVVAVGAIFVTAGIGGMIIAGLVIIVVGVPMAIRKMHHGVPHR